MLRQLNAWHPKRMAKGAANPTSPRMLTARARQARAVELKVLGWTHQQISDELDYSGPGAVTQAISAQLKRRERPAAEELAKLHMAQLELAIRPVMDKIAAHIDGTAPLEVDQIGALQLALVRNIGQQAKYVDVYAEGQGLGPIVSLLDRLMSSPPDGVDPDDPMTIPVDSPDGV